MDITTTETINDNFAKSFAVAEVFPEILSQLTREILREQPNNIHEFVELQKINKQKRERGEYIAVQEIIESADTPQS